MGARHVDLQLRERMVYRREKRAMALELGTERAQGAQHKTEQQGRQGIRDARRALDEERARLNSEHAARTEVHAERTTNFDAHLQVAVNEEMQKKEEHFDIDRRAADLAEAVARLRDQAVLVANLQAGLGRAEAGMAARDGTIKGLEEELERTRVRMVAAEAQVVAEAGQRACGDCTNTKEGQARGLVLTAKLNLLQTFVRARFAPAGSGHALRSGAARRPGRREPTSRAGQRYWTRRLGSPL